MDKQPTKKEQHEKEVRDLRRRIEELATRRSNSGKCYGTYAYPPGTNLARVISFIGAELAEAANINKKQTRSRIQAMLGHISNELKGVKKMPANGIFILSDPDSCVIIEPPQPVQRKIQRNEKFFLLDDLQELCVGEEDQFDAVVHINGERCRCYSHNGVCLTYLGKTTYELPKNHGKGGQSAQRYDRLRSEAIQRAIRRVVELLHKHFVKAGRPLVKNLVVFGNAEMKDHLVVELDSCLKSVVRGPFTVDKVSEAELFQRASVAINAGAVEGEMGVVNRVRTLFNTHPEMLSYGDEDIEEDLRLKHLKELICRSPLPFPLEEIQQFCDKVTILHHTDLPNDLKMVGIRQFAKDHSADYYEELAAEFEAEAEMEKVEKLRELKADPSTRRMLACGFEEVFTDLQYRGVVRGVILHSSIIRDLPLPLETLKTFCKVVILEHDSARFIEEFEGIVGERKKPREEEFDDEE